MNPYEPTTLHENMHNIINLQFNVHMNPKLKQNLHASPTRITINFCILLRPGVVLCTQRGQHTPAAVCAGADAVEWVESIDLCEWSL